MTCHSFSAAILLMVLVPPTSFAQAPEQASHTSLDVKARGAKSFYVDRGMGNNQISVFSESKLEDFTIVCNELTGQLHVDPGDIETINGWFSVSVKDLRTGIDLRDRHLRMAEWLDAEKYPEILIKVARAEDVKKLDKNSATMNLIATFGLHGRTRDVRIASTLAYLDESPETLRRTKGDLVRLRASLKIRLSDYDVVGPQGSDYVGLKVADDLPVKVTIFGSTEPPPAGTSASRSSGEAASQPARQPSTMPSISPPPTRPSP